MKKYVLVILFSASFIICSIFFLRYDKVGFYYGLDCSFCKERLPYNLKPNDGEQFSFTLKDEDDFELVGSRFRYITTNFTIKDFVAYGYNDTSVVIKCTDSLNTIRYLISYETSYKSKKGNPEISFKDLNDSNFESVKDKYQWFEVDKETYYAIDRNKFLSMLGAFFSLFFVIWTLVRLRSKKAID